MSLNSHETAGGSTPRPNGLRRLSFDMLAVRDRADRFEGVAAGTAKPLSFLAAFQEAEPYLGLPPHAFKLVAWLVKQTMAHDWEKGSRPIAWPSARRQQEFLGLSAARVKVLNRVLFERGIFVLRDNEQGRRYGRRGPDKRIIVAYGFDLTPLAVRYMEFVRVAAEAKTERSRMKALRARVTLARRAIRQAGDLLTAIQALPSAWPHLIVEMAELIAAARGCHRSEQLADVAKRLESLKSEAEEWVRMASKSGDTSPLGLADKPHTTSTNLTSNLKDTVIAAEESSPPAQPNLTDQKWLKPQEPRRPEPSRISDRLKLSVEELAHLVPRLGQYLRGNRPSWTDALDAAGGPLRHELGISQSLWAEACRVMGRDGATIAISLVATKGDGHFLRSAAGYFGGMVRRATRGELFLEKSLWGLRTQKYGHPGSKGRA